MRLLRHFLIVERAELMEQNVRLAMIGRREGLPEDVLAEFDRTAAMTAGNTGMTLLPGRQLRRPDRDRRRRPAARPRTSAPASSIRRRSTSRVFAGYLDTAGMPDPDLLIRTAGEMRVSNFLLWQISYAELWVTPTSLARLPGAEPAAGRARITPGASASSAACPTSALASAAPARLKWVASDRTRRNRDSGRSCSLTTRS